MVPTPVALRNVGIALDLLRQPVSGIFQLALSPMFVSIGPSRPAKEQWNHTFLLEHESHAFARRPLFELRGDPAAIACFSPPNQEALPLTFWAEIVRGPR